MAKLKIKSRSHHDVLHLHILANIPTQYQLPTPYSFRDIARTTFYRSRSLRQHQRSNQGHTMMLHTYTPNQCPYQVSTSYSLQYPRHSPDKILEVKVTMARHTNPPNQCPYQVTARTNFFPPPARSSRHHG